MNAPKVLIGCETSHVVTQAFLDRGYDAWSCDLLPADVPTNRHIVGDIRDVMMQDDWDLMAVMHPPCTRLTNSGVRWYTEPPKNPPSGYSGPDWFALSRDQKLATMNDLLVEGAALFSDVWNVPHIPCVAVENPVMHRYAKALIRNYEDPAQTVQPWWFGTDEDGPDNEKKGISLWLRNLPALARTGTLDGTTARSSVHHASPGPDRWKVRSKFFPGVAAAMAGQWGPHAQRRLAA